MFSLVLIRVFLSCIDFLGFFSKSKILFIGKNEAEVCFPVLFAWIKGWIFTSFACTYDLLAKIILLSFCFNEVERIRIVQ